MRRPVLGILFALGSAAASDRARAEEAPVLRPGLWEFHRTVGTQKFDSKKCADPIGDMRRMNAKLEKGGCKFSPMTKSGNRFTFTSQCAVKNPSGGTIRASSKTVLTVESGSAYGAEITGTMNGQPTNERLTARRVGDCPK